MIFFRTLRYRNFLSCGNVFSEFDLSKHQLTLIVGSNGAGKSSAIDAITFCLFSKTIRNINKPQLVNSTTQRDLLVEVEFQKGTNTYLVRRGIKPAIFEIYCNDVMLDQPADLKEYQETLEKHILQINFKAFCQIVVLGSRNYVPFLSLPAASRREIVEDLLDIQVFSVMNSILKDKLANEKSVLQGLQTELRAHENELSLCEEFERKLSQNKEEQRKTISDKIAALQQSILNKNEEQAHLTIQYDQVKARLDAAEKLGQVMAKLIDGCAKLDKRIKKLNDQVAFYEQKECPTCHQDIQPHVHEEQTQELYNLIREAETKLTKAHEKRHSITSRPDFLNERARTELRTEQNKLASKIHQLKVEARIEADHILAYEKEFADTNEVVVPDYDLPALKEKIAATQSQIQETKSSITVMTVAGQLLKDGGIKAHIIKQYIPVMNNLINKYLEKFDFFLNFQFDENFSETINSRFKDSFSYDSFSEGEKFRINLAILFAWREIAKIRNSSATNLLIMDEIFDSSLDVDGTDEFMKIVGELGKGTNIFIISHKVDSIIDKFQNVIKIGKNKSGFSQILSEA